MAGMEVTAQEINAGLIFKPVTAKNGDAVIVALTSDIPATSFDEGNIPLFIYMPNANTKEYAWKFAYLKEVASLHDILMGNLIPNFQERSAKLYFDNFNMATVSWSSVDVPIEIMDRDMSFGLSEI